RMGLGIKEDLYVTNIVFAAPIQIGGGQIIKIPFGAQNLGTSVINIKERLEISKFICLAHFIDAAVGQFNVVAQSQGEHKLRLQGSFNVQMQLSLGQPFDKSPHFLVYLGTACHIVLVLVDSSVGLL